MHTLAQPPTCPECRAPLRTTLRYSTPSFSSSTCRLSSTLSLETHASIILPFILRPALARLRSQHIQLSILPIFTFIFRGNVLISIYVSFSDPYSIRSFSRQAWCDTGRSIPKRVAHCLQFPSFWILTVLRASVSLTTVLAFTTILYAFQYISKQLAQGELQHRLITLCHHVIAAALNLYSKITRSSA
jgi:hypothetical protein